MVDVSGRGDTIIADYIDEGKYFTVKFIIELKIWRGVEYNQRGEKQLFGYLDSYGVGTGYLLSFNFNKDKTFGIQEISRDGKRIMEVVV